MPSCSYARLIKIVLLVELVVEVVTAPFNGAVDIVKTGFCTDELPSTITPREYDIDLDFADEFKSVRGRVDIYVEIDKPQIVLNGIKKRLSSACFSEDEVNPSASDGIALHLGKQLEFSPADVEVWTASSIEELREGKGNMVNVSEILRDKIGYGMRMGMIMIRLETNLLLVSGSYARITINYSSSDLSMVYAGEIYDARGSISGQRDYLYHTVHLEQGRARDLFPCFEGPNFKAKTRLTVRQPYVDRRVIANMPLESENTVDEKEAGLANGDVNQYHQTKFHQSSEPIPVSSLAFMIGPEETATNYHKAHSQDSSFTVNVFEPVGHSGEGQFAAEFALKAADWFHNYLNQPEHLQQQQHHHRLKYINLVAVPPNAEWNITHGHNIGLINHEFLLIDESMSSPERKIEVALNVAQVLAHQWFGNLVEPKTPRHLWITQGLAFHLAIQAVDDQMPEFQVRQYVKSNIRPLASGEIISRYSLDIESPCYHKALRGPLNNLRRVRGEQVFELIRANIIGNDDERFGEIIRSLAKDSTRTGGGIDRHELARAFVVDQTKNGYSSEQLGEIISMVVKYGDSKRMLSVRMAAREIVLERHVGTISVWPVNMFVQFNRGTSSLHAPVEVPIGEFEKGNKIIVVKMPDWFDRGPGYKEDWLKVELGEGQLMPYSYIQYSNDLVNRLGKAFQTHRLNKLERIDILNQQIFTLERIIRGEYIPGYIDQLAKVIELYNDELDPDVLLELMRAMDVCDQALSNCSPHYHEQLKHFYKNLNGLKVTGKEWPSLQRAKSRVTGMLVKLEDQEVIDEAIAAFDLGVDKVAAFMRDPIYRAVVGDKKGPNKMERSKRIDILNARWQAVGLAEERSRIMNIIKEIIKH